MWACSSLYIYICTYVCMYVYLFDIITYSIVKGLLRSHSHSLSHVWRQLPLLLCGFSCGRSIDLPLEPTCEWGWLHYNASAIHKYLSRNKATTDVWHIPTHQLLPCLQPYSLLDQMEYSVINSPLLFRKGWMMLCCGACVWTGIN